MFNGVFYPKNILKSYGFNKNDKNVTGLIK